jgi:hypothetical protein
MADAFSQHDYEQLDKAINEEMDIDDLIRHSAQGREALRDLFQEDKT